MVWLAEGKTNSVTLCIQLFRVSCGVTGPLLTLALQTDKIARLLLLQFIPTSRPGSSVEFSGVLTSKRYVVREHVSLLSGGHFAINAL